MTFLLYHGHARTCLLVGVLAMFPSTDGQVLMTSLATCVASSPSAYFNVPALTCQQCTGIQIPSPDGTSCVCPDYAVSSYTVPTGSNTPILKCTDCSAQLLVATQDQQRCISCGNSTTVTNGNFTDVKPVNCSAVANSDSSQPALPSPQTKACTCPVGYIETDYNGTGTISGEKGRQCLLCPFNSYVDSSQPFVCIPCPDVRMKRDAVSGKCVCQDKFVEDSALAAGSALNDVPRLGIHVCIPQSITQGQAYALGQFAQQTFYNVLDAGGTRTTSIVIQRSVPFATYYVAAVTRCQAFRHYESCQALANLCSLTLYQKTHPACQAFQTISATVLTSNVNGYAGWFEGLPWLYYTQSPSQVLFATGIYRSVALSGDFSLLNMTLTAYALNGTYLGQQPVTTQLELCPGDQRALQRFKMIGTNYFVSCKIDIGKIALEYPEPTFYELWINDPNTVDGSVRASGPALYPVPIIIGNYQDGGNQPNIALVNTQSLDLSDSSSQSVLNSLVLHRRFFLYDNWSGRKVPDSTSKTTADSTIQNLKLQDIGVVRWASYMELRVQLQTGTGDKIGIYPPYLLINYDQQVGSTIPVNPPGVDDPASPRRFPTITFQSTYLMNLASYWNVTMILFILLVIFMIIRFGIKVSVRNQSRASLPLEWDMVCADGFGTMADFFFWGLFVMCGYWFFFFKLQGAVKVLLPIQDPNPNFLAIISICIVSKVFQVALLLKKQCDVDIFFMDWEKQKDTGEIKEPAKGREPDLPNVSVWRNIMVANEWAEMQSERHTDIDFTLMFLLLFLAGLNYQYLATPQPNARDLSAGSTNAALRFFVICMWYFTVIAIQLIYKMLAYRFFDDPLDTFVDLCQLANISVFILDEPAHGYYIHGRSVHPHADVNMRTMLANFKAESDGNLPFRGLTQQGSEALGGASDLVFEMYVTAGIREEFRERLDKIRAPEPRQASARRASDVKGSSASAASSDADVNARAYRAINEYLQRDVIEAVQTRGAAEIRKPTALHRLLGFPPNGAGSGTGAVLLRDSQKLFSRVLFYGAEYDLVVFDVLVYIMWDLIFRDVFVAALLTYVVAHALQEVRSRWGVANIARKTLVDERLLI